MNGPSRDLLLRRDKAKDKRIAELEGELAKRDEALTIAYRLWLQDHHEEVGDYLLPFSTDFKREGGE